MQVPLAVVIAIGVVAFALPVVGIFFIPKLAGFLISKGLNDETLQFIDLVDDYFDDVERLAASSGIKGLDKLAAALTGMVEKLGRELTAQEKAVAAARLARLAALKKK